MDNKKKTTINTSGKPELLAPGGSFEGLKAAVSAGADAVYMGGQRFGARAYAVNPDDRGLLEAIDYCHLFGKKLYLTVNTLLKEDELEGELYRYLLPLCEEGLDAVLVQDFGVLQFIRKEFPQLPVHASTQMSVQSADGARMLKGLGLTRIVPARELTIGEIDEIHRQVDIEIETFIHGALCYSYSGLCLMSSLIGGRSGNRGRCAQPCRQAYRLFQEGRELTGNGPYLLSLKDICTLELLPELIGAGVCSFKIEGRMKRAEYAAGVTAVYRRALDSYLAHPEKTVRPDPEEVRDLMDLYNRGGFSEGYYHAQKGSGMMSMKRPNHAGTPAAQILSADRGKARIKVLEDLHKGDLLDFDTSAAHKDRSFAAACDMQKGGTYSIPVPGPAGKGGRIVRVRNEKLLSDISAAYLEPENKRKIKGNFILRKASPVILEIIADGQKVTVCGDLPETATGAGTDEKTVRKQLMKTGGTPFVFEELSVQAEEGLYYALPKLNALRREALEKTGEMLLSSCRRLPDGPARQVSQRCPDGESKASPASYTAFTCSVETPEQLACAAKYSEIGRIYADSVMLMEEDPETAEKMLQSARWGRELFLMLPPLWKKKSRQAFEKYFSGGLLALFDGFLVRHPDQLPYVKTMAAGRPVVTGSQVYCFNRRSQRQLGELGADLCTLPCELNARELGIRGCAGTEMIVYGHLPVMITEQCLLKNTSGCSARPSVLSLVDRTKAAFPVKNLCPVCANIIYNSRPLNLLGNFEEIRQLAPDSLRLMFTVESREETGQILTLACRALRGDGERLQMPEGATRGHFKRGVE